MDAITKTKLPDQSTPSRRRHNIVVRERITLDVWEVDRWLRDLTRLNETLNVVRLNLINHLVGFIPCQICL